MRTSLAIAAIVAVATCAVAVDPWGNGPAAARAEARNAAETIAERFAREAEEGNAKRNGNAAKGQRSSAPTPAAAAPAREPTPVILADAPANEAEATAAGERELRERLRAADEAEMLARAKAEAADRQLTEFEALNAAKELAEREAAEARQQLKREDDKRKARIDELMARVAETEARAKAAEEKASAEAEARRRAEAQLDETRTTAASERAELEQRAQQQADAARLAAEQAAAARNRVAIVAKARHLERRVMEVQREGELDSLSRKLELAEAMRRRADPEMSGDGAAPATSTGGQGDTVAGAGPAGAPQAGPAGPAGSSWPVSGLGTNEGRPIVAAIRDIEAGPVNGTDVTVLLVMTPGTKGIRRGNPTADPVLCVGDQCYVSAGADRPSRPMARWQAFGTFNTLGKRADACRNQTACVFRKVDLESLQADVQPVDLRLMRHDRREVRRASPDGTCRFVGGHLICNRPLLADTYKLWVVPERLAERVGAEALVDAVRSGLKPPIGAE